MCIDLLRTAADDAVTDTEILREEAGTPFGGELIVRESSVQPAGGTPFASTPTSQPSCPPAPYEEVVPNAMNSFSDVATNPWR